MTASRAKNEVKHRQCDITAKHNVIELMTRRPAMMIYHEKKRQKDWRAKGGEKKKRPIMEPN